LAKQAGYIDARNIALFVADEFWRLSFSQAPNRRVKMEFRVAAASKISLWIATHLVQWRAPATRKDPSMKKVKKEKEREKRNIRNGMPKFKICCFSLR
jgi:hypothetical protein